MYVYDNPSVGHVGHGPRMTSEWLVATDRSIAMASDCASDGYPTVRPVAEAIIGIWI